MVALGANYARGGGEMAIGTSVVSNLAWSAPRETKLNGHHKV